ncbi:MAG: TatA/E family twin arginine-targeting protein translocase [Cyanothece sp. SIO2G6]|nr:TatA/E family twin arginine-targeting protein translocase [Cyanothece sp. SIO2G6]
MNVFGIGLPEMAIIFIVALLVFGPKKLPEIGRTLGKAIRSFQDATKEFETEFKQGVEQIEQVVKEPMTATIEPPEPKAIESGDRPESAEDSDTLGENAPIPSSTATDDSKSEAEPVASSSPGTDEVNGPAS